MEDKMSKLTIEIGGRMYQDWDNEVFSWDIDNPIRIFLDETLLLSKSFRDFSILEETNENEAVSSTVNELSYYKIVKPQTCQVETESGEAVRLPYVVCNIKSTGETVIKYGKWHLKAELSVKSSFQLTDLIFVKLENLANAIQSGEPNFASIVCLEGHGEILFKEVASNIKDQYDCEIH